MSATPIRRHIFAKLSALFLLALILSPFTAPFATYDLSPVHHDILIKDKTETDPVLLVPPVSADWLSAAPRLLAARSPRVLLIEPRPPRHTVLRL